MTSQAMLKKTERPWPVANSGEYFRKIAIRERNPDRVWSPEGCVRISLPQMVYEAVFALSFSAIRFLRANCEAGVEK